jgi:hypothetical protein
MRLLTATAIALTIALVTAGPAHDLIAAPRPHNPRVTVTFADDEGLNIKSDGRGAYTHGSGGVIAYLDGTTGELIFSTSTNTGTRELQFLFDDCVAACIEPDEPLPVGAPYPTGYAAAGILAGVRTVDGVKLSGGLLAMPVGSTGDWRSGVKINIPLDSDPAYWTLCRAFSTTEGICAISDNSMPARIIRNAADLWTISAAVDDTDITELFNEVSIGRKRTIEYEGAYSMPFSFTVQCVNATCS